MSKRRVYHCTWCDKELQGYRKHRDHEYHCPLNPKNAAAQEISQPMSVADVAQEQEPAEMPEQLAYVASEQESNGPDLLVDPGPPQADEEDAPDALANMIDARIGFQWARLEQRLNEQFEKRDQEYGQQFRDAIASLPSVIDQSVRQYLTGPAPGSGASQAPAPPAEVPGGNNQGKGTMSFLGNKLDLKELAIEFIKSQGGGNINQGIIKLLTGQGKKARQVDSKYVTRGMGNMLGVLRMKNANPTSQAVAFKSQAEMMLKETLTTQMRDFYIGQKSICDAFLQGQDLHKVSDNMPGPPAQGV